MFDEIKLEKDKFDMKENELYTHKDEIELLSKELKNSDELGVGLINTLFSGLF